MTSPHRPPEALPATGGTDWRLRGGELSGAVADLGVFVPLVAALVVVNGLRPGPVLVGAGLLVVAAGLSFRVPFPVQPLKALAAIAIAGELSAEMVHAGGLLVGVALILLTVLGLTARLAAWFTRPVIRSLQLGVGGLLVVSAVRLVTQPPPVFAAPAPPGWAVPLAAATLAVVAVAVWRRSHAAVVLVLVVGIAITWVAATPTLGPFRPALPTLVAPELSLLPAAFALLVVPQLPLTFGNAVVGVSDLARQHFGDRAQRVTPPRVALSTGVANVGSALIGGMPMCHGSSGFSAHVRLGASSPSMNLALGAGLLALGLIFPGQVLALFGVLPAWALGGFLVYAGLRHALLVTDLRGRQLVLALVAGGLGLATGNLAVTTAVALLLQHAAPLGERAARALPRRWRPPGRRSSRRP